MTGLTTPDATSLPPFTDDELSALALAADPDEAVDPDAVSLWDVTGATADHSLPEWYMPAPVGGTRPLRGWRRRVVFFIIASFLAIDAYGLCNTYGQLTSGTVSPLGPVVTAGR